MNKMLLIFLIILLTSCKSNQDIVKSTNLSSPKIIEYFDSSRERKIPVAIYAESILTTKKMPVLIFSHGYGRNAPESNLSYAYLLENLAKTGYFVASIQHELPTDDLVPLEGNPQVVRRPNWNRGAENILFVLKELQKDYPDLDYKKVIISGHSNGGDMSTLFTEMHPDLVWKLITLDQRRYAFPRISQPKIYSLRSSDQPADTGVLPTLEEQNKFKMKIVELSNTIHNDMDDGGTLTQKEEILKYFLEFLGENKNSGIEKIHREKIR